MTKIQVGNKVLFYGHLMTVESVEDGLVRVAKADTAARSGQIANSIAMLRAEQMNPETTAQRHGEIADEITALDHENSLAGFSAKLRVDLLTFWDEREIWISEGRVLSDLNKAVLKKLGMPAGPENQRHMLTFLDGIGAKERSRLEAEVLAAWKEKANTELAARIAAMQGDLSDGRV